MALTSITEKLTQPEKNFVSDLKHLAGEARRQAYRSADHLLVVRNWLIGWRIVAQEQNGKERAKYGKHVIELGSQTLTDESTIPFYPNLSWFTMNAYCV